MAEVVKAYPHIKGVNFDLPHVVATAPAYDGVSHVGGDMFESIPYADAIFMKVHIKLFPEKYNKGRFLYLNVLKKKHKVEQRKFLVICFFIQKNTKNT